VGAQFLGHEATMVPEERHDCKPRRRAGRDNAVMRRTAKRLLGVGMLAATAYAVWRAFDARRAESDVSWEPQPFPFPPVPRSADTPAAFDASSTGATARTTMGDEARAWVEPVDDACPVSHPVKGKLSSGIYHVTGGANYERTRPDRCYSDTEAAEADGLRAAKA